jgi:hypothetical protein
METIAVIFILIVPSLIMLITNNAIADFIDRLESTVIKYFQSKHQKQIKDDLVFDKTKV